MNEYNRELVLEHPNFRLYEETVDGVLFVHVKTDGFSKAVYRKMLDTFDLYLRLKKARGVDTICVYVPESHKRLERLARLFGFSFVAEILSNNERYSIFEKNL